MQHLNLSFDLGQIAEILRISHGWARARVRVTDSTGARGELRLEHGAIPLARVGRRWLARRSDVEIAIWGTPQAALVPVAPQAAIDPEPPRRGSSIGALDLDPRAGIDPSSPRRGRGRGRPRKAVGSVGSPAGAEQ